MLKTVIVGDESVSRGLVSDSGQQFHELITTTMYYFQYEY